MKKLIFSLAFVAISLAGFCQNTEKTLKANKWYATGIFDGKNIILSKTAPAKSDWDAKFAENGQMNFCSTILSPQINAEGNALKAGDYYCDPSYTYELKGDMLHIKYPLVDYYYKVKTLANGNLELQYTDQSAIRANTTK